MTWKKQIKFENSGKLFYTMSGIHTLDKSGDHVANFGKISI